MAPSNANDGEKLVAANRKALHDYQILERYEAGMVLTGTEVKAIRDGRVNFKDSYATVRDGQIYLVNCHVSPYSHGNRENHDPVRQRKLLLHRREIHKLAGKSTEKGLTLVPLRIYFKAGRVKLELGVARGKKVHDKRQTERDRDARREIEKHMKTKQH
ncbi:MAG: SsrA-binding protein SmpB [Acidobacteriota bacterium]